MTCPGAGPALICSNQLDGSAYGFTLTVPGGFTCVPASPLQALLVLARVTYSQESTGIAVSIAVSQPSGSSDVNQGGVTVEDQPNQTSATGVEFQVQKLTLDLGAAGMQTGHSGGTTLPSGNNLIITVSADSDLPELATVLSQIIETVALAGS
jgi:hypothetical protein